MDEVAHTDNPSTGGVVAGKSKVKVKVGTSLDHGRLMKKKKKKQKWDPERQEKRFTNT